jgi:hypothetical protein
MVIYLRRGVERALLEPPLQAKPSHEDGRKEEHKKIQQTDVVLPPPILL